MIKTCSMSSNRHFKRVYSKGKSIAGAYLVLYYQKNNVQKNILGITVSKKIGKAVTRNRIRRLIRESYRLKEDAINNGYDLIFVARTKSVGAPLTSIQKDMQFLLRKSGLCVSDSPKTN